MPPIPKQKLISLAILVLLIFQPLSFVLAKETANQNQPPVFVKLICDDSNCIGEITAQVSEDVVGVFPFVYDVESNTTLVNIAPDINLIYTYNTDTTPIISYILTDHLNSTNIITDQTGAVIETTDYYPYGTIRLDQKVGSFSEQRKYIGQEYDELTKLNYLNARYYDSKRGQFISQDPVFLNPESQGKEIFTAFLSDPQTQNSYGYARGNPITLSDADGKFVPVLVGLAFMYAPTIISAAERGLASYFGYQTAKTVGNVAGTAMSSAPREYKNEVYQSAIEYAGALYSVYQGVAGGGRGLVSDGNRIGTISRNNLPKNTQEVLNHLESNGLKSPMQGYKGGGVFENKEGYLPQQEKGYYQKWDTTLKEQGRTAERIVTGKNGEVYYTNSHYGDPKLQGPAFLKVNNKQN